MQQSRRRKPSKFAKILKCLFQTIFLAYLTIIFVSVSILPERRSDNSIQFTEDKLERLERLSSVDYFACCGLGHRLIRMSLANYVAKVKGFSLRSFWGWCGEQQPIEVFSYLFFPQTFEELHHLKSEGVVLPFYNEVPGFQALARTPTNETSACSCHHDKIEADYEMYTSLRNRFRQKKHVDSFVQKVFNDKTVIGIHVRAGNGEGGDFERKGRNIEDPQAWTQEITQLLLDLIQKERFSFPPIVYIATDTPSMVSLFRKAFQPQNIPVFDLPHQERRQEGQGVLFGVSDKVHNKDEGNTADDASACLKGWSDTLTDMFLLSHADVVVATTPSSFSQTAPMSLSFGNRKQRIMKPYCEVTSESGNISKSHSLQCYDSYYDWCCNFSTWIRFQHRGPHGNERVHAKEFVKFLSSNKLANFSKTEYRSTRMRSAHCPRPKRGRAGGGLKDKCIPHVW